MLRFQVYLDDDGQPQAEVAPPHELLAWFLTRELGTDAARARELLAEVDRLMIGAQAQAAGDGQLYRYELTGDQVRLIDPSIDPPDVAELSLGAFRFVLDRWLALLG